MPRSEAQHGFVRGRSTETAWEGIKEIVSRSGSALILGLFVDFTGAFDILLWGPVLDRMGKSEVDRRLGANYFTNRAVIAQEGTKHVRYTVKRGFPQSSICGPYIWNLMMDELLRCLEIEQFRVVAYADDLFIAAEADKILMSSRGRSKHSA